MLRVSSDEDAYEDDDDHHDDDGEEYIYIYVYIHVCMIPGIPINSYRFLANSY